MPPLGVKLLLLWLPSLILASHVETALEEMELRKLPNGDLLVMIDIMLSVKQQSVGLKFPKRFPLAIDVVAQELDASAWEMTFVQGHWDAQKWGAAPFTVHPHGAELVAWMDADLSESDALLLWQNVTSCLSGLFCASLDAVKKSDRVIQTASTDFVAPFCGVQRRLHAFLPQEPVCVENLTPWLKLTPCKGKKGLTSIFRPQSLFQGVYHQLQTNMKKQLLDDERTKRPVELIQQLYVVFPSRALESLETFSALQNAPRFASCPVADSALVHADLALPIRIQDASMRHQPTLMPPLSQADSEHRRTWALDPFGVYSLDMISTIHTEEEASEATKEDFGGHFFDGESFLLDNEGNSATFVLELRRLVNRSASTAKVQSICLLQSFPWVIRIWMHTLRLWRDHNELGIASPGVQMGFQLSEDRKASSVLRLCFDVSENVSSFSLTVRFSKAFYLLEEHPPDAYRGVDIPPAIVHHFADTFQNESCALPVLQSYIGGCLVRLLVPDFSMPYNVCCLTCTVLALYYGVMLKLMTTTEMERRADDAPRRTRAKLLVLLSIASFFFIYYRDFLPEILLDIVHGH